MLTKGQVITPVQCLAWRPRLTCQRPYSPSASSPTPGQGQPSRARCRQGQGQQGLGAAGCSNGAVSPTGCPPQPHLTTTTDLKLGRREKAQNSGLSLCIIAVFFLRMAFRFSLN